MRTTNDTRSSLVSTPFNQLPPVSYQAHPHHAPTVRGADVRYVGKVGSAERMVEARIAALPDVELGFLTCVLSAAKKSRPARDSAHGLSCRNHALLRVRASATSH